VQERALFLQYLSSYPHFKRKVYTIDYNTFSCYFLAQRGCHEPDRLRERVPYENQKDLIFVPFLVGITAAMGYISFK